MKINVQTVILVIVGVILMFSILGAVSGDLINAAGNASRYGGENNSTMPLISLFSPSGVIMLVLMAGILIGIVKFVQMKKG